MRPEPAPRMVSQWLGSREAIKLLEAVARPDLVDGAGRRWAWWTGDLYRHTAAKACAESCQGGSDHGTFAWPLSLLPEPVAAAVQGGAG